MKKYKLSELVLDFDFYPRGSVDAHHVTEIASAIDAGSRMPPIVIDKKTKRIVDGVHRHRAFQRLFGVEHEVECVEKTYANDGELLLDAMRYNVDHGRALTAHDKTHCVMLAERLKLDVEIVRDVLHLTKERLVKLVPGRVGKLGHTRVALKQTIRHMGGKRLTQEQVTANDKLGGMNQLYYVNQLITLIENDLIDTENENLLAGLSRLGELLQAWAKRAA